MRVSTSTMYEAGITRMNDLQSALFKTQQQVATGRRVLTPADDPVAAAQTLNLKQSQAINTQFATNRNNAKNALSQEEVALQSVTGLIQDVRDAIIQAGNSTLGDEQRGYLAVDLRSRFDELLNLANSRDGQGNFIFGGYQIASEPFAKTATGAAYNGDQGKVQIQVDAARQMATNDAGDGVFMHVPSAGTFRSVSANPALSVSPPKVVDAREPNLSGARYEIAFAFDGTNTTYTVTTHPSDGSAAVTGVATPFDPAVPIEFDGRQVSVTGTPADGDTISIEPEGSRSMFAELNDLIALLETPATGAAAGANLAHGLGIANANSAKALDHVLAIRASIGSRLKEIDTLDSAGAEKDLQYASAVSTLEDLDYNQALSDLARQQLVLQAAQQSFVKVSGLSLFNYLP